MIFAITLIIYRINICATSTIDHGFFDIVLECNHRGRIAISSLKEVRITSSVQFWTETCQPKKMHNMSATSVLFGAIWGAWEATPHIALRDCSKEVVVEGKRIRFRWRGSSVQSSTFFYKRFLLVTKSWCHHEVI